MVAEAGASPDTELLGMSTFLPRGGSMGVDSELFRCRSTPASGNFSNGELVRDSVAMI